MSAEIVFLRWLESIRQFANAGGIQVVRVFEERAVCGKRELENRPALSELLEALHSDGVRTILIEKLDLSPVT